MGSRALLQTLLSNQNNKKKNLHSLFKNSKFGSEESKIIKIGRKYKDIIKEVKEKRLKDSTASNIILNARREVNEAQMTTPQQDMSELRIR
mmetsp:Transcript_2824/g.3476  ORF Transcript_2824/g.3476 Transcript_2824/m.3476 type:complete len:91 (-) Transcript_2824:300-572(-)